MKESNQMIENRLKRAVEASVPDLLPRLLEQIEKEKESPIMNTEIEKGKILDLQEGKKRSAGLWRRLAPIAAALVLALGGWFAYDRLATQAVVGFDVNPSLELSVNRAERVLQVKPANEEAERVIGDMRLKGVDLDVAVNALIGSMVRNGYITEAKNSILITVDSKDSDQALRLQRELTREVNSLLDGFSLQGAILSQTTDADSQIRELARQYGISPGKAVLIEQLVEQDPSLRFADIASLSINDLKLLLEARQTALEGVESTGQASRKGYIGEDRARQIAFEHAGVRQEEVTRLEIEMDYEDGRLIYELEFYLGSREFEYEIDAKDGRILEFKSKDKGQAGGSNKVPTKTTPTSKPAPPKTSPSSKPAPAPGKDIGARKAEDIALSHAGFTRNSVSRLETEKEWEKGRLIYEVEFEHGNYEYEYEIDALTGQIIEVEIEGRSGKDPGPGSPPPATTTAPKPQEPTTGSLDPIGSKRAEDIALQHAGLARGNVRELETELETKKGRLIYEVEFKYAGQEYEYHIDAASGQILKMEIEKD